MSNLSEEGSNSTALATEYKCRATEEKIYEDEETVIMTQTRDSLRRAVSEGSDLLRKLQLVKLYSEKHDLNVLDNLIQKWRCATQEIIQELMQKLPEPKPSTAMLLANFGIDTNLVRYDVDTEEFY